MGSLMHFPISIRVRAVVEMKQNQILSGLEGIFKGARACYFNKNTYVQKLLGFYFKLQSATFVSMGNSV